jgi:hypothetical protein
VEKIMDEITQEELKEMLNYDADTGLFTWVKKRNRIKVGGVAGCIDKVNGYRVIKINGKLYRAHRLAFLYMTGKFPTDDTDHINHDRSDNRFVNLRKVTHSENLRNSSLSSNNTSGFTGVFWDKARNKWKANININGRLKHLGLFTDMDDAIIARKRANVENEYHANHGAIN